MSDDLVKQLGNMRCEGIEEMCWAAADRIEELEAKLAQQDDLMQAAVAAALRKAANRAGEAWTWTYADVSAVPCQEYILALITPDAQAALDRVVAAERKRAHNAGRKHERDLIYVFAQRMDTEGKAYAEQILVAIRKGGE